MSLKMLRKCRKFFKLIIYINIKVINMYDDIGIRMKEKYERAYRQRFYIKR